MTGIVSAQDLETGLHNLFERYIPSNPYEEVIYFETMRDILILWANKMQSQRNNAMHRLIADNPPDDVYCLVPSFPDKMTSEVDYKLLLKEKPEVYDAAHVMKPADIVRILGYDKLAAKVLKEKGREYFNCNSAITLTALKKLLTAAEYERYVQKKKVQNGWEISRHLPEVE